MGIGRPVMYAFVESEQFAPMRRPFGLFEEMMGEQYPVRTFVVDKLAAQMRSARVVFGCDVTLCYFHIRKAIRKHTHSANSQHIFHRMAQLDNAVQFRQDLQLLRRTDPRFVSYLTARWLYVTRKWAAHAQSGMVHFGSVTRNPPGNASCRLKDRVHHAHTLELAIQKVSRHAERLMREFYMHTSYHCDRRLFLEGDGYVLNVVCRMTTWRSRGTDLGSCVLCDRPTTTSDRRCATDRVSHHADCYDGEPCPLCSDALQACPKGIKVLRLVFSSENKLTAASRGCEKSSVFDCRGLRSIARILRRCFRLANKKAYRGRSDNNLVLTSHRFPTPNVPQLLGEETHYHYNARYYCKERIETAVSIRPCLYRTFTELTEAMCFWFAE
ncbi:hypothetical protein CLF_105272 [Clonorchis sinensis]|uniref:MULE transposase domain-containing protein n=1 Tax=Clonorchis sinensis TaxID=79923 RepID=G7YP60_CLOSI|nr:hypothetical protein CLF_105272 [Clonorchis sinensis]